MTSNVIYKLRAEFPHDVMEALNLLPDGINITHFKQAPDCEFTIGLTDMDLNDVLLWLAEVVDGHVMCETVALEENYTGKRTHKSVAEMIGANN